MKTFTPLVIEVRANEFASTQENPHVPLGAEAMVTDALVCLEAGAASYHWHARGEDGIDRPHNFELHAQVIKGIRKHSDMILHPTLGFTSTQGDVESRLSTIKELIATGNTPDIVPVDVGSVVIDKLDDRGNFITVDELILNKTDYLQQLFAEISRTDLAVLAVVWSPGAVRTVLSLREQGLIPKKLVWQLGFTGVKVPGGLPASEKQLDAFLDQIPAGEPWNIHVRDGDGLEMAVLAILRGGHVAIGLGDDPYLRLGQPTNAELVARLVDVATTIGRRIATPAEARQILGIPLCAKS